MKRRTKPKSDPYRVMMGAAHDLEMEGIDAHTITDALFVAAVHGALVIVGREAVAESLREMAVMVEGKNSFRPMIAGRAADDCRSLQIAFARQAFGVPLSLSERLSFQLVPRLAFCRFILTTFGSSVGAAVIVPSPSA
jgi:hypothetical protein